MAFIESSDFAGKYKLSQDTANQTITTRVIGEMRDGLIRRVFGSIMGNEIIAYLDTTTPPVNTEFDNVINPFSEDLTNSCCFHEGNSMIESIGLKNVLIGFIYYQRACDMRLQMQSVGGETRPKTENTTNDMLPESKMIQRYNDSVNSVWAIQKYICEHKEDYPDYNGQKFTLTYIL